MSADRAAALAYLDRAVELFETLPDSADKADAYAKERSFDVDVLAQARLAPDQFSFVQQVQSACDHVVRPLARGYYACPQVKG